MTLVKFFCQSVRNKNLGTKQENDQDMEGMF